MGAFREAVSMALVAVFDVAEGSLLAVVNASADGGAAIEPVVTRGVYEMVW